MATIEYVKEIDDLVEVKHVFATATDKSGLVGNKKKVKKDGEFIEVVMEGIPEDGLIGLLFRLNPDAVVISTGGTAKLIADAGHPVTQVGDYTGWPEMKTGLVKSMSALLYAGMLAHPHTKSDAEYMAKHKVPPIDMVLANFYPFDKAVEANPIEADPRAIELIRQNMDVGGPTAIHTSRKGFLTTAAATRPEDYARFARDLEKNNGAIGLDARFAAMQNCGTDLATYYNAMDKFWRSVSIDQVRAAYPIIHNPAPAGGGN